MDLLPLSVRGNIKVVLKALGQLIHEFILQTEEEKDQNSEEVEDIKPSTKLMYCLNTVNEILKISPIFIHFFTHMF